MHSSDAMGSSNAIFDLCLYAVSLLHSFRNHRVMGPDRTFFVRSPENSVQYGTYIFKSFRTAACEREDDKQDKDNLMVLSREEARDKKIYLRIDVACPVRSPEILFIIRGQLNYNRVARKLVRCNHGINSMLGCIIAS